MSKMHIVERKLEKSDTHRTHWSQEEQKKEGSNLPNKLVFIDSGSGFGNDIKNKNIVKLYNG